MSHYITNAKDNHKQEEFQSCSQPAPAPAHLQAPDNTGNNNTQAPMSKRSTPLQNNVKTVNQSLLLLCTHEYDIYCRTEFYNIQRQHILQKNLSVEA